MTDDDNDDEMLPPEMAAILFEKDPGGVIIAMDRNLLTNLGLTEDELLEELRGGRLIGVGQKVPGGYQRVGICGDELLRWLRSDSSIAQKASLHLRRGRIH